VTTNKLTGPSVAPLTGNEIVQVSKSFNLRLVFLCETRQNKDRIRHLRFRLGIKGFAGFSSDDLSGGLALFWHENLCVEVIDINERYIDAYIQESPSAPQWRLTCVYGEPRVENCYRMWDTPKNLKATSNLPWLVMSDFNEALWQQEHLSCTPHAEGQMAAFRETLTVCNLVDLGFTGLHLILMITKGEGAS
jgi:hypothetical protein